MKTRSAPPAHAERVLQHMRRQERPVSAYQILDGLRSDGITAATTIYRALEQLRAAGRIHRIESLNAWTVCCDPSHATTPIFEICSECGAVTEHIDTHLCREITRFSDRTGFAANRSVIEIHGRCGNCRVTAPNN